MGKEYDSIIDAFLDDREPRWEDSGLADAKKSGEALMDRTHDHVDEKFMDEIAEGASHHTPIPPNSKGATLRNRMLEKESAAARLGAARQGQTRVAYRTEDYKSEHGDDQSLFNEVTMSLEKAEAGAPEGRKPGAEERNKSDEELKAYVKKLLNQGTAPKKVAELLEKVAEIQLLDKKDNMGANYLNQNQGTLGMAYLEPNTYMDEVSPTYERTASESSEMRCAKCNKEVKPEKRHGKEYCPECLGILSIKPKQGSADDCVRQAKAWKAAGITPRAWSVKKVTACDGCALMKNKTCTLYGLPVVANAQELAAIINKHTAGVPAQSKRAALVQIANREPQQVKRVEPAMKREASVTHKLGTVKQAVAVEGMTVEGMHKEGMALDAIYRKRSMKVGSVEAGREVKRFVASLQRTGAKVALSQIDCKFLKNKLGMKNAIVGASKCADCCYRTDMHCGLTGGTLLTFPGMEKTGKVASAAKPTDAVALLKDYDLTRRPASGDIDISGPDRLELDIDKGGAPSAGNI